MPHVIPLASAPEQLGWFGSFRAREEVKSMKIKTKVRGGSGAGATRMLCA